MRVISDRVFEDGFDFAVFSADSGCFEREVVCVAGYVLVRVASDAENEIVW